ncbi:unnamed protein product [Diamesa serratosioi]
MFLKVCAILLLGFISTSLCSFCENVKCNRMPPHYTELGCKPVMEMMDQCCVEKYDCSTFLNRDPTKCYYKNKIINPGSSLDESDLRGSCIPGCHCVLKDGKASFQCAHYDCFNWSQPKPNCIIMNKLNDCCRGEEVCGKKLATCNYKGKSYKEGDIFFPKKSCHKCVCTNDFEDVPVEQNRNCKKIECAIDLHYADKLRDGCAPVYGKDKCCPNDWQCPRSNDKNLVARTSSTLYHDGSCKFGKLTLQVGDKIIVDSMRTCTCLDPPMIECKQLSE